jgi:hypothetical protein
LRKVLRDAILTIHLQDMAAFLPGRLRSMVVMMTMGILDMEAFRRARLRSIGTTITFRVTIGLSFMITTGVMRICGVTASGRCL